MANGTGTRSHEGRGPTRAERIAAKERLMADRPWCHWCGKLFTMTLAEYRRFPQGSQPTLEHIKPISKGGTEDYSNLALACHGCNTTRRH